MMIGLSLLCFPPLERATVKTRYLFTPIIKKKKKLKCLFASGGGRKGRVKYKENRKREKYTLVCEEKRELRRGNGC